jgi:hypothetical protein
MGYLLERARIEPMLVLCEKPMAPPQDPRMCPRIVQAVSATQAVWMYNFLELYDPMTHAIIEWLRQSGEVKIHTIETYRGKEREDPDNPRNYKPIVSIEYQEAIHDMAFLLYLFGALAGNLQRALRGRVLVRTLERQPYNPPNKNEYSREVNGSCKYHMLIGSTDIEGQVSFKEGAPKAKWKVLRGIADGQPFVIRTSTQEDNKWLKINGTYRDFAVSASTYEATIQTLWSWYEGVPHKELMMAGAIYPNPVFAWAAYQLSGALWCSGWRNATVEFGSFGKLLGFDAGFPEGSISLPFYRKQ